MPVLDLVGQLGKLFLELGADPSIKETFKLLLEGSDTSVGIVDSLKNHSARIC